MLTTGELAGMRADQLDAMPDTCQVLVYTSTTQNVAGEPVVTYPPGDTVRCGLRYLSARERAGVALTATEYDAELRLPLGTAFGPKDRIGMLTRYGAPFVRTFEIAGGARVGPSAILVNVREVVP